MNRKAIQTIVVTSCLIAASSLGPARADPEDAEPVDHYLVSVDGGPDEKGLNRLKAFYERMLVELRVSDLGYANIGCDKCLSLVGEQPEGTGVLKFRLRREGLGLAAFMLSYHYVQTNEPHDLFMMSIDGRTETSGHCPVPLPTGCRKRTICIDTSECDKPYGGKCQVCPPNP
jgi:hypothetical protein